MSSVNLLNRLGRRLAAVSSDARAEAVFHSWSYLRHTARRLEHLASLRIDVRGASVLEVGAGIGDHTHYYLDRDCSVTVTEVRPENLAYLRQRYPQVEVSLLDMDNPVPLTHAPFDVVHSYGLLYHLKDPGNALKFLSDHCSRLLFLETCVSFGDEPLINPVPENKGDLSQSILGSGCRPTRNWVWRSLKDHFAHVYVPQTQPNHEEFPLDWSSRGKHPGFSRAVFVAARQPLSNELLLSHLPDQQARHE
ncbi:MAG: class I SAM-dependent methyltransferase [Verrucomicrobia bacterium]|nr:class I SAM-dependent methyltransferase [Verrucomicrobiota bacterium]